MCPNRTPVALISLSLTLIHIFEIESSMRAFIFFWDGFSLTEQEKCLFGSTSNETLPFEELLPPIKAFLQAFILRIQYRFWRVLTYKCSTLKLLRYLPQFEIPKWLKIKAPNILMLTVCSITYIRYSCILKCVSASLLKINLHPQLSLWSFSKILWN